jgi:hypothetical protein
VIGLKRLETAERRAHRDGRSSATRSGQHVRGRAIASGKAVFDHALLTSEPLGLTEPLIVAPLEVTLLAVPVTTWGPTPQS